MEKKVKFKLVSEEKFKHDIGVTQRVATSKKSAPGIARNCAIQIKFSLLYVKRHLELALRDIDSESECQGGKFSLAYNLNAVHPLARFCEPQSLVHHQTPNCMTVMDLARRAKVGVSMLS